MSTKRKKRNLQVLIGRAQAEVAEGGVGVYIVNVGHDEDCPGLINQSMLSCTCTPEMNFNKWEKG